MSHVLYEQLLLNVISLKRLFHNKYSIIPNIANDEKAIYVNDKYA